MASKMLLCILAFLLVPYCYAVEIEENEQRRLAADAAFAKDFKMEILVSRTLRTLITQEKFDELENLFGELELQFAQDPDYEHAWILSYDNIHDLAFRDGSEEALLIFFDRWIDTTGSYIAHAAKGSFLAGLAGHHRGTRYSADTPAHKFANMHRYAALAKESLSKALDIKPAMLPAYVQLIGLGRMTSEAEQEDKYYQLGLRNSPTSYWLHWEYMYCLTPKWGGTIEAMFEHAQSLEPAVDKNPRIWRLLATPLVAEGNRLGGSKNYESAIDQYTQALEFSQHPVWLARRAFYAYRIQRYPMAIADLEKIIEYGRGADHASHLIKRIEKERVEGMEHGRGMPWYNFDISIAR